MSENPWETLAIALTGFSPLFFVGGAIIAQELEKGARVVPGYPSVSIIRCERTAERLEGRAHPEYTVSYHMTPSVRGAPARCYIDVANKSIADIANIMSLKRWEVAILSRGSVSIDEGMYGQVPTIDEKAMVKRIEKCGGMILGIHSERTLTGKDTGGPLSKVAHVHFASDPRAARCLTDTLLREP